MATATTSPADQSAISNEHRITANPLVIPIVSGLVLAAVGYFLQVRSAGIEHDRAWQQKRLEMKYEMIASAPRNIESSTMILRRLMKLTMTLQAIKRDAGATDELGLSKSQIQKEYQDLWPKYAATPTASAEIARIEAVFTDPRVTDACRDLQKSVDATVYSADLDALQKANGGLSDGLHHLTDAMLHDIGDADGIAQSPASTQRPQTGGVTKPPGTRAAD